MAMLHATHEGYIGFVAMRVQAWSQHHLAVALKQAICKCLNSRLDAGTSIIAMARCHHGITA